MTTPKFDEVFDFLVVGNGGGSMCAALLMRSLGKSVVILEKTGFVGGTTARSGGVMWIPNNRFMAEEGVKDSFEQALAYIEATAGQSSDAPGSTPERRRAYISEAPRMIDFLISQGIRLRRLPSWPDYHDELPGSSVPGRTVVAELFDINELGEWKAKLRPGFMLLPAHHSESFELTTYKSSWVGKMMMLKVGLRVFISKLLRRHLVTAGRALQGRMLEACLRTAVDIRLDTPVRSFIVEDGAVTGVEIARNGQPWRIGSRIGVLVNAGGFAQNQEMRDKYAPGTRAEWTAAGEGDTGEMIRMMMDLGAAIGQMNERVGNQMAIPPGVENRDGKGLDQSKTGGQMNIAKPHSLLVDQSGVRYMNECGSYMGFCQKMLKRNLSVPSVPSWWIVDEQYIRQYMFIGDMPGTKKPKVWFDSGFLKRADTIEQLAGMCDIDPAVLRATVDRFNTFARNGSDEDFGRGDRAYDHWLGDHYHRPSNTLGTIEEGPFYAAPVVPGDVGTYGGVVTDEFARVLREDGTPIRGLYATGTSTASVMGRFYPGAGASVGPSFTWGYVAAKHAARLANAV